MRYLRLLVLGVTAATAASTTRAEAQSGTDQVTFYGFLNQAYGVSGEQRIQGLTKDPTTDYRAAALQARFAISPVDNFVVQAVTRPLGVSPAGEQPGAVTLDWAFYQHRFEHASLRVGRVPAPFGFLAEIREVGTLLPFYRAPATYYVNSFRSSDGFSVINEMSIAGGMLETNLYGGGTSGSVVTYLPPNFPIPSVTTKLRFERNLGVQFVYTTPIEGIRLLGGYSALRALDTVTVQPPPAIKVSLADAGVEARFDRAFARGEIRWAKNGPDINQKNYYAQAGVRPIKNLWINAQGDFGETANRVPGTDNFVGRLMSADRALSLSYQFAPNIVTKLERHWAQGGIDGFFNPTGPLPNAFYSIASLAVSF
jgi:hypothetical protein